MRETTPNAALQLSREQQRGESGDIVGAPGCTLSLGVSIVLFRMPASAVAPLVAQLLEQGAAHVYLIDNSPAEFGTFEGYPQHARVTSISTGRNLGYGRANNIAIRKSVKDHKYHLICNPDIVLGPHTLPRLCEVLERRTDIGLCMPRVVGQDGSVHHLCKRAPSPLDYLSGLTPFKRWHSLRRWRLEMRDFAYDKEMDVECLSGCFMFFRSSVLEQLGGFDEQFFLYFEDFDLSRRAKVLAHNVYLPFVHVIHGYAREHRHSLRVRFYFITSAIRYFSKWGWRVSPAKRSSPLGS